jgi:hypothetical protein
MPSLISRFQIFCIVVDITQHLYVRSRSSEILLAISLPLCEHFESFLISTHAFVFIASSRRVLYFQAMFSQNSFQVPGISQ